MAKESRGRRDNSAGTSRYALYSATQKKYPLAGQQCSKCSSKTGLQRHHPSYESTRAVILCQTCHVALHRRRGDWGRGKKFSRDCEICGKHFTPGHTSVKTCSRKCLTVLGKHNAAKRWVGHTNEGECIVCRRTFTKRKSNSKTCSMECFRDRTRQVSILRHAARRAAGLPKPGGRPPSSQA